MVRAALVFSVAPEVRQRSTQSRGSVVRMLRLCPARCFSDTGLDCGSRRHQGARRAIGRKGWPHVCRTPHRTSNAPAAETSKLYRFRAGLGLPSPWGYGCNAALRSSWRISARAHLPKSLTGRFATPVFDGRNNSRNLCSRRRLIRHAARMSAIELGAHHDRYRSHSTRGRD